MRAPVPHSFCFLGLLLSLLLLFVCSPSAFCAASIAELKAEAESGSQSAEHQLIHFLIYTDPGAPGYNEALAWLREFATNNPDGQLVLGYLYNQGRGVARDYAKAAECYQAAANRGLATAENNLAYLYQEGLGVEKNLSKAFDLYLTSAKQGNAAAQYNLANLYVRGLGAPRDYLQAARWFQAAANQGHAVAQYDLGVLYVGGLGVPRDYSQAAAWIRLAAEQRETAAETDLGRLYEAGKGVPLDYAQAYAWYSRAVADGDRSAQLLLKDLSHLMTPAQIEHAKSMLGTQALPLEQRRETAFASPSGQFQVPGPWGMP